MAKRRTRKDFDGVGLVTGISATIEKRQSVPPDRLLSEACVALENARILVSQYHFKRCAARLGRVVIRK